MSFNIFNTTDGLYCYGSNYSGQLGLKDVDFVKTPTKLDFFEKKGLDIDSISFGDLHTVIKTNDGVYTFGDNRLGQTGFICASSINLPRKLHFFKKFEILTVSCGSLYTIINTVDGLYGFGDNSYGQLGLSHTKSLTIPTKLDFFVNNNIEIISISCGKYHTITITNDGLYVFGSNEFGQLGLGDTDSKVPIPTKLDFFRTSSIQPNLNIQFFEILSVTCGDNHTLIHTTNGLYCLGSNHYGQLGLGDTNFVCVPTKLDFIETNSLEIFDVSCGSRHTILNTTDNLYVFGDNSRGQLGLGHTNSPINTPTKLDFFEINAFEINFIFCRLFHAIISTNNGMYGFGFNDRGQLGLGHTNSPVNTPTKLDFEFNLMSQNKKIKSACSF